MKRTITMLLICIMVFNLSLISVGASSPEENLKINLIDYSSWDVGLVTENDYTASSSDSEFSIVYDSSIKSNVLKMKPIGDSGNQLMCIPLGTSSIDTGNGAFVIEIKAKFEGVANRPLRGFPILSDGEYDNVFGISWMNGQKYIGSNEPGIMISANNQQDGIWTFKSVNSANGAETDFSTNTDYINNVGSIQRDRRFFAKLSDVSQNYYTYKWIVNPDEKTFRFYYSADGKTFIEPWGDLYMANPYTSDLTDRFSTAGIFPTGTLPDVINVLKLREYDHTNSATAEDTSYSIASIKTYPYVAYVPEGNVDKTLNFSDYTTNDVKDYNTGLKSSATTKVSFEIKDSSLEITTVGGSGTAYPEIPLGDLSINTNEGPFSLRVKAKLYNHNSAVLRNFPSLGDDNRFVNFGIGWCAGVTLSAGNNGIFLNANNRADGMWSWKTHINTDATVGNSANNVNLVNNLDRYFMGTSDASLDYYTYRWDIDPQAMTFRFFYKKDGDTKWIQPWADYNMVNPYISTPDNIVRFDEKGIFPTGDLPEIINKIRYEQRVTSGVDTKVSIKSIQVVKALEVMETSVEDGEKLQGKELILKLNGIIDKITANAESVQLYEDGKLLDYSFDYNVDLSGNTVKISLSDYIYGAKYTLKIPQGKLATTGGISFSEEYVLNFFIETDEDVLRAKLEELSLIQNVSADDAALLYEIKALVKKMYAAGVDVTLFDNYNCYEKLLPDLAEVSSTDVQYSGDNIEIRVMLDTKVQKDIINTSSVQLLRGNKQVDYTIITDGDLVDSFLIKLENKMINEQNIRLNVKLGYICQYSDFFDIPNDFTRSEISLYNSNNEKIYDVGENDGTLKVNFDIVNNTYDGGAEDIQILTAIYDDNSTMLSSAVTTISKLDKGIVVPVSETFEGLTQDAKKVSVFVWNGGIQKPLMLKKEYKKTYGYDKLINDKEDITVAFIGGSLTQGGNYTTPFIEAWSNHREGKITVINAGIGGTGSNFGAMRLKDDVLVHKPDIVFVEFATNDLDTSIRPSVQLNAESIIRQCQAQEHEPVVGVIHIPRRIMSGDNYTLQTTIDLYEDVISHYGISAINGHQLVVDKLSSDSTDTWDNYIPANDVHPNALQGKRISDLMFAEFINNYDKYIKKIHMPEKKFSENTPDKFVCSNITSLYGNYDSKWVKNPEIKNIATEGYGNSIVNPFKNFMATYSSGAKMSFEFSGTRILVNGLTSKYGRYGTYEIKDENGNIEASGSCKSYTSPSYWYENILLTAFGLPDGKHTLEITVSEDKQADKEGYMFGIGEIWVDEE